METRSVGKFLGRLPRLPTDDNLSSKNEEGDLLSAQSAPSASSCALQSQDLVEEVQAGRYRSSARGYPSGCGGTFAEAKHYHELARARYHGRSRVHTQTYLSATAQNLKRLVCLFIAG